MAEIGRVAAIDAALAADDIAIEVGDVIVRVDPRYYRPAEVDSLLGDASLAQDILGWRPTVTLDEMISEMIANDLSRSRQDRLLMREGFSVNHPHE